MANGYNEALFTRGTGHSDESDVWDDTALIKAYDKAVVSFKNALKGDENVESPQESLPGKKQKNSKKKKSKKKSNTSQEKEWRLGDTCCAVWSEDGQVYPASIASIDQEKGTCVVVYTSYGNEEEQELDNLLSDFSEESRVPGKAQVKEDAFSTDESDQSSNPLPPKHQHKSKSKSAPLPPVWGFPPHPPPGPGFRMAEPRSGGAGPAFPGWPPMVPPGGPPMIPPPPPSAQTLWRMVKLWVAC
ncbi:hypothetical protein COCON_G00170570 [Conger conger]|uniref:Tudor domain-containing protein n=1 Tax=Conger conger TaxID=82655 RepID=A0A9Q1HTM7_CONCO|nr:hypothetical protein COCON_G00170570 [Conger conger]